jgi:hypothetical protein
MALISRKQNAQPISKEKIIANFLADMISVLEPNLKPCLSNFGRDFVDFPYETLHQPPPSPRVYSGQRVEYGLAFC